MQHRRSDVLIEHFRPGSLEKWGCGYERLSAIYETVLNMMESLITAVGPPLRGAEII